MTGLHQSAGWGQDRAVARPWPRWGCWLVALLVGASFGACSDTNGRRSASDAGEQWSADRVRAATARAWLEFPGGYEGAALNRFLIEEAEHLVADCMTDQGFEYGPAPYEAIIGEGTDGGDFSDRTYVAQHGFGATEPISPPAIENPNDRITASLSDEELAAYDEAHQGCNGQAQSTQEDRYRLQEIIAVVEELNVQVESAGAVAAARGEYRECMASKGFTAASPEDIRDSFFKRAGPTAAGEAGQSSSDGSLREEEIEAALASYDCGRDLAEVRARERRHRMEDLNPAIYELVYT